MQCSQNEIDGVRGISFLVQSKVQPPPVLTERIDGFLRLFRGTLLLLSEEDVRGYTASLAAQFVDVDSRLDAQAGRLWGECAQQRYDFERPWRNADRVKRLPRAQLLAFYDRCIADGSPTRRRLVTQVFAPGTAPEASTLDAQALDDVFFPPPSDRMAAELRTV